MKTSSKFSTASLIAFLVVFGLLMNGAYKHNLNYTEVFLTILSAYMIMILESCSGLMAIRETLTTDALTEIQLMNGAKGCAVEVTSTTTLPRVHWYMGGRLIRNSEVVAIVNCMWTIGNVTRMVRVMRTLNDRLPVTSEGERAFINVPQ